MDSDGIEYLFISVPPLLTSFHPPELSSRSPSGNYLSKLNLPPGHGLDGDYDDYGDDYDDLHGDDQDGNYPSKLRSFSKLKA